MKKLVKYYFLALLFLMFTKPLFGQFEDRSLEDCYVIQFVLENANLSNSPILPIFQKHGFQVIENGVYDLIINGEKHFQSLLLNIDSTGFSITENWYFDNGVLHVHDTLNFTSSDNIIVRLLTINNGVGGLPFKVGRDYIISFIKSNNYCSMKYAKIDSDLSYDGLFYFTGYGWKKIKMIKGKPYLCEQNGQYRIRRK